MKNLRGKRATPSLIPFGMSGLKYVVAVIGSQVKKSHPVWDEWIEIVCMIYQSTKKVSHPVWDEWIEIGGAIK